MCRIHRKTRPDDGFCLCKDVNCDCYKERNLKPSNSGELKGGEDKMDTKTTTEETAFDHMNVAFEQLNTCESTRTLALAKTNLEQAMMWLNKHRAIKGELEKNKTHVE